VIVCVGGCGSSRSQRLCVAHSRSRPSRFFYSSRVLYVIFILFSSAEVTYCIVTLVADRAPLSLHFGGAALFAFNKCVESRDISERGGIYAREVRDLHLSALSLYYYY
jgi:hypothetical protein